MEGHGIVHIVLLEDGYVQGQACDNKIVILLLKPGGRGAFLLPCDIIDRPGELRAMEVHHDATLHKVGLVAAEGVVVVFAVCVVRERKFAILVRFFGEVELQTVAVAGIGLLAVCEVPAPAISASDPANALKGVERGAYLLSVLS